MKEFDLIEKYFKSQSFSRSDVLKGIGDDCAVLNPSSKLVVSTDTLVEGTHFLKNITPYDLGYKSLAVNLSDIAAMCCNPSWALLSITLPNISEMWMRDFCAGYKVLLEKHNVQLVGGDTTKGPLSITWTVMGSSQNKIALRSSAKVDELVFVTGNIGDSFVGLEVLLNHPTEMPEEVKDYFIRKHLHPVPRIDLAQKLRTFISACIDVSDGLYSELCHIAEKSNKHICINIEKLPTSKNYKNLDYGEEIALSSGEEYELCFTAPKEKIQEIQQIAKITNINISCIGTVSEGKGVSFKKNEKEIKLLNLKTYEHFSNY